MIKGDPDTLNPMAERHVCAEHKKPLSVAWYGAESIHVLRCGVGEGHYPDTIDRIKSLTEEYKEGEELPAHIEKNVVKASQKAAVGAPDSRTVLGELPKIDLGTGEILVPEIVAALQGFANVYGLDAFRGHIVIFFGKPYIGIDGYLFHANRTGIPYDLSSRPLDGKERTRYKVPDGSHAWLATVAKGTPPRSFIGLGIVEEEELTEMSKRDPTKFRYPVVAKHPWLMAQKRAEWQAMRRAFPIGATQEVGNETL